LKINRIIRVKILFAVCLLLFLPEFESESLAAEERNSLVIERSALPPRSAEDLLIVDCLLPGQIRLLGSALVYVTRGRPVKTTALECELRGGQFPIPGQSDYTKALMVWLPDAKAGDMVARYYVGEIYQRGLGADSQYLRAAEWFRKSAEQGYAPTQLNLGYFY
jgi:TPR repeat protein